MTMCVIGLLRGRMSGNSKSIGEIDMGCAINEVLAGRMSTHKPRIAFNDLKRASGVNDDRGYAG